MRQRSVARVPWIAFMLALGGCYATAGYDVPIEDDYGDMPPPGFVATAPVYYYEGRPAYWYHDHWHYRDGGRWRHFRTEPAPLRDFRSRTPPPRPAPMGRAAPFNPRQPAPGAPMGRGRASPRMWERPGRLQR